MSPEAPTSSAPVAMSAFFTRSRANEGVELPLDLPDGTPSGHVIRIRGVDSDEFRKAKAESSRRLMEIVLNRQKATAEALDHEAERLRLLASLVLSWSFPDACTPENVFALLKEAPQLADQIDRLASNRELFFGKGSLNSSPSPSQSLS